MFEEYLQPTQDPDEINISGAYDLIVAQVRMDDNMSPFVRDSKLWELKNASGVGVVSAT